MFIACVNVTNLQLARAAERAKEFAIRVGARVGPLAHPAPVARRRTRARGDRLARSVSAIAQYGVDVLHGRDCRHAAAVLDRRAARPHACWCSSRPSRSPRRSSRASRRGCACRAPAPTPRSKMTREARRACAWAASGAWLVIVEVTVSCILLVVSRPDDSQHPRDEPSRLSLSRRAMCSLPRRPSTRGRIPDLPAVQRAVEAFEESIGKVPGVRHAALATAVPGTGFTPPFALEGQTYAKPDDRPRAAQIVATPELLRRRSVSASRQGRFFTRPIPPAPSQSPIVDEAFAAIHLAGGPAIGTGRSSDSATKNRRGSRSSVWSRLSGRRSSRTKSSSRCICRSRNRRRSGPSRSWRATPAIRWRSRRPFARRCRTSMQIRRSRTRIRFPASSGGRAGRSAFRRVLSHVRRRGPRPGRSRDSTASWRSRCVGARTRSACAWRSARAGGACCAWSCGRDAGASGLASRSVSGPAGSSARRCARCSRAMSRPPIPVVYATTAVTLLAGRRRGQPRARPARLGGRSANCASEGLGPARLCRRRRQRTTPRT